ncbi:hypothetical protein BS50DRAFT_579135 [Corynespora cassiicola Philippines]|uniref:Reverse transcriptase domain-containing protein n=1 Tax=Corynespora cassiicola Philippines TaxID=1448308 RepID=A0A2T2N5E7_CORCC|nr:hypothetical protein BS50DRAFT_579135 [Corynespora cassiicola Philippines]
MANSATPVLSTLQHVTERKLNKLAIHRSKFESEKQAILAKVAEAPDQRQKVQALLEGFDLYDIKPTQSDVSLTNLNRFVHQAKHDPSVSGSLLRDWQKKLEHELDIYTLKYDYAALFGQLVTEWIKNPNPAVTALNTQAAASPESDTEMMDSFDQVGRKEMHEQRQQWESYAFTERKVDQARIEAYLNEIFGTTQQAKRIAKTPLQYLRDAMKNVWDFKSDLQPAKKEDKPDDLASRITKDHRFTEDSLKASIAGVLQSDLFAGEKREALVDLQSRPTVLKEMVDVLNMDLDALDEWQWEPTPIRLTMRRQLNGKYRVYMDEETHQAILLHFVGNVWAVQMKRAFTTFYLSRDWQQTPFRSINKKARQRRDYFLKNQIQATNTIRNLRRGQYKETYFMLQLPDTEMEAYRDYAAGQQDDADETPAKTPMMTKQSLLRLVTTEMLLNTKIYGEFTVVQSDFKWFGPSLPHDTIFAVLKFLGVPEKWLRFFKKFLESPVAFAQDGPDAPGQRRKCGIPMSHILSDALGEAVLFCLDFAVNKRTQGSNIYRFHDDLWFWGQQSTCIRAWHAMEEFSSIMGLQLNEEKTGAALVVADKDKAQDLPLALPRGKVKWGFLVLDPLERRWVIDRDEVDKHIEELKRQLGACRSVMAWIQAWNSYVNRFFTSNFGEPANCFGRQHNDQIIDTFEHIQRSLFADAGTANVTEYLRSILKERFHTDDSVPDGFFYFPIKFGGLGLRNPFISVFATYKNSLDDAARPFDRAFEVEKDEYEINKERWESGVDRLHPPKRTKLMAPGAESGTDAETDEPFFSLEEYTRYSEDVSYHVCQAYYELLRCPPEEMVEMVSYSDLGESPYWIWIYNLYAGDIQQRFGSLQFGERDLLPVGLVDVLKSERVRWEG